LPASVSFAKGAKMHGKAGDREWRNKASEIPVNGCNRTDKIISKDILTFLSRQVRQQGAVSRAALFLRFALVGGGEGDEAGVTDRDRDGERRAGVASGMCMSHNAVLLEVALAPPALHDTLELQMREWGCTTKQLVSSLSDSRAGAEQSPGNAGGREAFFVAGEGPV
jgi:hypothetical protein